MFLSKQKKKINYLFNRKNKKAGRNNTGRITVAHQGNGHKQLYRIINFKEIFQKSIVLNIEYDPNRSARIAKICSLASNKKKIYQYIICPKNLKVLDILNPIKEDNQKQIGNFYFLKEFKSGDYIYNIEIFPKRGGQIVRSAGTFAKVLEKIGNYTVVVLPSGEHRMVSNECKACYGNVSNEKHFNNIIRKAGRSRWLNKRPTVRGVAMNPIDHPHGGNTSGGRHPKTPWSRLTKGVPTKSKKKINKLILKASVKKK